MRRRGSAGAGDLRQLPPPWSAHTASKRDLLAPVRPSGLLSTYQRYVAASARPRQNQPAMKTGTMDEWGATRQGLVLAWPTACDDSAQLPPSASLLNASASSGEPLENGDDGIRVSRDGSLHAAALRGRAKIYSPQRAQKTKSWSKVTGRQLCRCEGMQSKRSCSNSSAR